jgi:hypothetical protein
VVGSEPVTEGRGVVSAGSLRQAGGGACLLTVEGVGEGLGDGFEVAQDIVGEGIDGDDFSADGFGDGLGAGRIDLGLDEYHPGPLVPGVLDELHQLFRGRAFAFGFDGVLFETVGIGEVGEGGMIDEEGFALVRGEEF